jgi:putative hydroxymethylpyrimidine transporter CytX
MTTETARPRPPESIAPVPLDRRTLSPLDVGILWNDLSLGVLVLLTGGFLAHGLDVGGILGAIAVGTVLGCLPLAAVALAGAREGVPSMVLFRPVLGRTGSILPSVLNVAQLLGWTAVELWAMALLADALASELLGIELRPLWLAIVTVGCTGLALGGPALVVKRFLERFGTWIVLASMVLLTIAIATAGPGAGGTTGGPAVAPLPFWLAVDLVIVMPVSWLPLVADTTRFARGGRGVFASTFAGYAVGNAWCYLLGALLVREVVTGSDVAGTAHALGALAGGTFLLVGFLVGEAPNAFANVYSTAVSALNVRPRVSQRLLVIATGAIAFLLALLVTIERYEVFLFLIGSVFVPLAGVFVAEYFVSARGGYGLDRVFGPEADGVRWRAVAPWVAGFVVYHWSVPTGPEGWIEGVRTLFTSLGLPFPLFGSRLGASVPSFALAFVVSLLALRRRARA